MRLCAKFFGEDIYVVDRGELLDLAQGHVTRGLDKQNAFFQKFPGDGGAVHTLTLQDIVEVLEKEKINIVEHNGMPGMSGHFAAYVRTRAPTDKMKELLLQHEVQKKPDTSGKVNSVATTKGKRLGLRGSLQK